MTRSLKDLAKASLGKSDPLSGLIDRYFLERKGLPEPYASPGDNENRAGRFSPSSTGDEKCMRAAVFRFLKVPGKSRIDPEREITFAIGNSLHLMWYGIFLHMEKVLGKETFEVIGIEEYVEYPKLLFAGRFDVLVKIMGTSYIVDFKTINDRGFGYNTRKPDPGHRDQLVRYLRLRKVRKGLVFYLNKNDSRWKVHQVRWSDHKDVWTKTAKWVSRAVGYMKKQEVPPRHKDCEKGSRMANDCPWSSLCYGKEVRNLQEITYGKGSFQASWEEFRGKANVR